MGDPSPAGPVKAPEGARERAQPALAEPSRTSAPLGVTHIQRLGSMVGNRQVSALLRDRVAAGVAPIQRVAVKYTDAGETLLEDPAMKGADDKGAKAGQYVPRSYGSEGGEIKYDMDRTDKDVTVTVRILFVDQQRDTRQFIWQKGKKVENPDFRQDVGSPKAIKGTDPRRAWAEERCAGIGAAWDHYDFVSKKLPPPAPPVGPGGATPAPAPTPAPAGPVSPPTPAPPPPGPAPDPKKDEIRLKVKFVAKAEFDPATSKGAHTTIRLFGPRVHASRDASSGHWVDAGHWYMDASAYGDTTKASKDATAAHEYGHLIGLQDEYSRSDDYTHQMMHRMGGGARNAHKELDRHTVRQMVTLALYKPISERLNANIGKVVKAYTAQKKTLSKQLTGAVKTTWADASLQDVLVNTIQPNLKNAKLQAALANVVKFQTTDNLSNVTLANDAMTLVSADNITNAVIMPFDEWQSGVMGEAFKATGADGKTTNITSEYSSNISDFASGTGAGAAAGKGVADTVVGGGAIPPVHPSPGLLAQIEAIPATWSNPGQGIDAAYTTAFVNPRVKAAAETAVAAKVVERIGDLKQLYVRMLTLVSSTARSSTRAAVWKYIEDGIKPKVDAQLTTLKSAIDTEVDATMGMSAGAVAAKGPGDPHVKAVAEKLHELLKKQQDKTQYDKEADANPGQGSAGADVRHTAESMMGSDPGGTYRGDMMNPVLKQFNDKLRKKTEEEPFRSEGR